MLARPALPVLAAVLTAAFLVRDLTDLGGTALRDVFDLWVRAAIFGSCALALLLRARRRDGEGLAWLLAALALLAWESGDVVLTLNGGVAPVPSTSDALWLLLYPLLAISLALLLRRRVGDFPRSLWLDGTIGALATAAITASIALPMVLDAAEEVSTPELVTNLAYPIGDLLLLGTTAGVIGASGWRLGRTWSVLGLAFAVFAVTDTMFLYASAHDTFAAGGALDVGWFVAAVLIAFAAVPAAPPQQRASAHGRRLLIVPGVFATIVLALLLYAAVVGIVAPAIVLAAGAFLALILRMLVTFVDMERATSALATAHAAAEELSRTDQLTGLANRRAFAERLLAELDRSSRGDATPGLLILDVDRFKRVNDRHGHGAGDEVLKTVARRLARAVRGYDSVARWGGEEFAVIVPDLPDQDTLLAVGERIREAIAAGPITIADGTALAITVSVGGAMAAPGAWSPEALAHNADLALYSAKRTGRNRVCIADHAFAVDDTDDDAYRVARSLALAGALREGTTPLHCEQVGDLAAATALRMGLPASEVRRARLGGLLHDVGKVAMPDGILSKRGPLDDAEWVVMKTHTITGEQIISHVDGLDEAAEAVRHHHERWDGSGYPDRLAGERIPIAARIVAAADAYAAITDDRVYRRGRTMEEAIEELRRSAGSHLDPDVVTALIDVLETRRDEAAVRLAAHRAQLGLDDE